MTWHVVKLFPNDTQSWIQISTEFEKIYINSSAPQGAAVYDNQDTINGSRIYFSPVASEIAKQLIAKFNGSACDKPTERIVPILSKSDFNTL